MDKAPDAFRTISEVADDLDIPQHVLRFWETRFTQIKPMKRSGGRRYYRPDDVDLLRGIRRLLYGEGYTIRGVQRILKENGIKAVQGLVDGAAAPAFAAEVVAKRRVIEEDDLDDAPAPDAGIAEEEEDDEAELAPVVARREPEMDARRESDMAVRREPEIAAPRVDRPRPQAPQPVLESRPMPPVPSPANRLDRARLEAVLQELVACRQVLDTAMKDG
ncbi:MAG: transcriptional regulator, MerR family [Tardiphaga sp.]|uniref:MerR family transcriptional regulator n=1 Tax=Tardiphaga sp. TaxID=1926292 RepID=UPI00263082D2|nr:MerR family transcriptional regulator [Tardiphaga sp.]MDB5502618.1 transcriptional regulator, MerR family [Tardiphaga sp.]